MSQTRVAPIPPDDAHAGDGEIKKLTPDMRREQTRSYLIDAAAAVFLARGFHMASLDEIAGSAGFTKGAIYSNFGSKAGLFFAVADRREQVRFTELVRAARRRPDRAGLREAMRESFLHLVPSEAEWLLWQEFELYALRRPDLRAQLTQRARTQFDVVVEVLRRHLPSSADAPAASPEALAHLFIGVFERLARARAVDPELVASDMFAELIDLVVSIVFGDAGSAAGTGAQHDRTSGGDRDGPGRSGG